MPRFDIINKAFACSIKLHKYELQRARLTLLKNELKTKFFIGKLNNFRVNIFQSVVKILRRTRWKVHNGTWKLCLKI